MTTHKHTWEKIGTATVSGDTWMQESYVYACSSCGECGTGQKPHVFFDYKRRPPAEVQRLRADEQAAYAKLIADYRADPERVRAAFAAKQAERKAYIDRLRAEATDA